MTLGDAHAAPERRGVFFNRIRAAFLQSTMIIFDVSSLLKAPLGKSITLDIETGAKKLDDLEVGFLKGTIQVVRVEKGLFVEGEVESQLRLECVRCLTPFVFPVTLTLAETFRLPGKPPEPGIPYAVRDDHQIDLGPLLRELALLAIPMKPLCDPDCKGLCPQCGVNLNEESCACEKERIDPRMAALKDLL